MASDGRPDDQRLFRCCCSTLFLVRARKRALALGDGEQRRIELDKGGINRRMCGMAGIAVRGYWDHFGGFAVVKAKECPPPRKTRFVLHVYLEAMTWVPW